MMRDVDAVADDHRVIRAFEQDARQLGVREQQVVGPFQDQRLALVRRALADPGNEKGRNGFLQSDRSDQR